MIVGEVSGDALGASLIQALRKQYRNQPIIIEGIVGPKLIAEGAIELFPMRTINVMGLFEPLKRLPELWRVRKSLIQHFTKNPPDVFIGIDAPDFNLGVEQRLRQVGIKTVHYVSPTIWAWRAGRIKTIKKAVDLMLTIFPFEKKIYDAANIPACFVGHPFADEIALEINTEAAKEALGFKPNEKIIALLPGSRDKELQYLASAYLETAKWCYAQNKTLNFVLPVVSEKHKDFILQLLKKYPADLASHITVTTENARLAMAACDTALVTSGTATFEMMLHKKPMIVGYKMNPITYQIAKRLVKLPYIAMANIVAGEALAPEFIQGDVVPEKMGRVLLEFLEPTVRTKHIIERYTALHQSMRKNASAVAASAILALAGGATRSGVSDLDI